MIKLSKTGSYALKAVIYIAKSKDLVHIADISEFEKVSLAMLRRIIPELEKQGIVETIKGRNGGIKLGKKIHQISVFDILDAVGEELGITDCTKGEKCKNISSCSTTHVLHSLQKGFHSLLHIYTLDKVIK